MSRLRRYSLYLVSGCVCLSGASWLYAHYLLQAVDSFGFEGAHPAEKWSLIAHAALSFYGMWWFGMLWPNHITKSWKAQIRRVTGGILFGCIAWLMLTGCALYYIGSETWRSWFSILHWAIGVAVAVAFIVHLRTRSPRSATTRNGD